MRITPSLERVAVVLMSDPLGPHWGYETLRATKMRSGVLYPLLGRLYEAGWLVDGWEDAEAARQEGRLARRYYKLTDPGLRELGAIARRTRERDV